MQSFGSHNNNCGNVTNSNNMTITLSKTDDEGNQIKLWLSPLEPQRRHRSVQINRVDGVGDWLLGKSEFLEWSGSQQAPRHGVYFATAIRVWARRISGQ